MEPFQPPQDFEHGEEFAAPVPRSIPQRLRTGSHGQRERGVTYSILALGVMCIVLHPIPFVQGLTPYLLPLKWLKWFGFGLLAIGFFKLLASRTTRGRYVYVTMGEPFVGRVLECRLLAGGTAEAPTALHVATVEFRHPQTGESQTLDFPEPDQWPANKLHEYSCTLQPGEYVTLVHLPEKQTFEPVLYGFLGLDPDREYILRKGEPLRGTSPFTAVMISFLVAFIVLLVMAGFDLMLFSFPIDGDWKLPTAIAVIGLILGGISGIAFWKNSRSPEKSKTWVPSFLGYGILGAVSFSVGLFILNSRLDFGESTLQPVRIVEFWETTTNFVVRNYEIEYEPLDTRKKTKHHIRFSQLLRLQGAQYGAAEISPGAFGFPWIRGVHPLIWLPVDASPVAGPVYHVAQRVVASIDSVDEAISAEELVEGDFVPVIVLERGQVVAAPESLLEPAVALLKVRPEIDSIHPVSTPPVTPDSAVLTE